MNTRDAVSRGGFAAAACVACCAPLVIAAVGVTAGIAITIGIFIGLAAAIGAVLVGATWTTARLHARNARRPAPATVPLAAPTRRVDR